MKKQVALAVQNMLKSQESQQVSINQKSNLSTINHELYDESYTSSKHELEQFESKKLLIDSKTTSI
jgi:isocitrate/isopropylmalate dehydrogenase